MRNHTARLQHIVYTRNHTARLQHTVYTRNHTARLQHTVYTRNHTARLQHTVYTRNHTARLQHTVYTRNHTVRLQHIVYTTFCQRNWLLVQRFSVRPDNFCKPSAKRRKHKFPLNPLNPELNPICYLLALLGAHHLLHVSRIRVKLLTFRLLMSYMYGARILDVSRSHTTTQYSR